MIIDGIGPRADIQMQIAAREGMVALLFSRLVEGELRSAETDNFEMGPEAALNAAEILTDFAFEADTKLKPVGPSLKPALIEKHREHLRPILRSVLRSMINDKKPLDRIAEAVLDECCREIFS